MTRTMTRALVAAAVALAAGAALAQDQDPAFGLWLTENQRAIVEIGPCAADAAKACGTVVWLVEKVDAAGQPRLDEKNPDAAQRTRPLCGLPVVGDFTKASAGNWEDGFIYDGAEGETYNAWMEAQADGALKVRGYVGVSLLGKSQIWTRVADKRDGC